jgi:lycopene beta-cyclase
MDHHYDIAIIGMGCAGSHVVLELLRRNVNKKIVVIDNYSKEKMTKTWSFWEKGIGKWDDLVYKSWDKAWFKTASESLDLDVKPYSYKSIDSAVFTAFAKAELEKSPYFTFVNSKVEKVQPLEKGSFEISCGNEKITSKIVLDSRIDPAFFTDKKAIALQQHFKGWVIETKEDHFDPERFTMMDYTLMDAGTTSFTYVLPFTKRKALVEFTYFSPQLVADEVYDMFLKQYIKQELKISDFEILEIEQGIIPMSTYNFQQHNAENHLKIGTAGGWVKPSTGYSFKSCEKKAAILVENILKGEKLDANIYNKKAAIYDATLLEVLSKNNENGDQIFEKMYKNNKLPALLKFLDEETSFIEDVRIMAPMTSTTFVKAFFKQLF